MNSGKYKIENNQIVNIATGVPIPADEPVFILRAQDKKAMDAIDAYRSVCLGQHGMEVLDWEAAFARWQTANPDKVHEPD